MDKSYLSNPYRYVYAPRTLSEANRDAEYASAIHYYQEPGTQAIKEVFAGVAIGLAFAFIIYLFFFV